jgi:hypothetical protein
LGLQALVTAHYAQAAHPADLKYLPGTALIPAGRLPAASTALLIIIHRFVELRRRFC